jgi:hypothetical protein
MANEKRLISYDALIAHLDSCIEQGKGLFKSVCVAIKCFVEQMPTVDAVEVVRGRWDVVCEYEDFQYASCSACGKRSEYMTKFCPNCGAKMNIEKE